MKKRPKPKKQTCALYHRVSTRDQNPTAAAKALRAHAKRLGLRVVLYSDEVASSRAHRPELERVMAAARKGQLDAIIVWKLDRFGRSMIDLLTRLRELESLGVRFIASTQGIDLGADGGAASRYYLNTLAAAAEFERELIVERTHLGLDHARRRGVKLGRPRHRLDLDRVRELRAQKKSWDAIAGELGVARETIRCAVERDARSLLQKSYGRPDTKALRDFVARGQAAQRAVDELIEPVAGSKADGPGTPGFGGPIPQ
jgi:DNA invertase Pin-like site-specific DNA recombinase